MRAWVFSLLGLLTASCIAGTAVPDHALYPASEGTLPREKVARLVGYVQMVDGQDVGSQDSGFLVLPGCHSVITPSEWGRGDPNTGAVTARTGPVLFALPMLANRQYMVEVQTGIMTGPTGTLSIKAYERDAQGKTLAEFTPAKSEQDFERCRARFGPDAGLR